MVDAEKYVVLDVETNGLSSVRDDLLSISIYKPDTDEAYNRFLPLELDNDVKTSDINGIKKEDLENQIPLSQEEVDEIVARFELKKRTILTYGNLDERFISKYFLRHQLDGMEYFAFYNFKHEIISSKFSEGNVTKDNLCKLYGIENIKKVHSGNNDCILEWKLFEKMDGKKLLITENKVFEFNDKYIVPVSLIESHPNMKYYIQEQLLIDCEYKNVFSLPIVDRRFIKFPTNFNGEIVEHLINSMLMVRKEDSRSFMLNNKKQLKYLGKLPSETDVVPVMFNSDGTMTATRKQDFFLVDQINKNVEILRHAIKPVIDFIAKDIFGGKPIKSQELVVHPEQKIMALCDLSNANAVLEIKTVSGQSIQRFSKQLYYESNGRKTYILQLDWERYPGRITFNISEIFFKVEKQQDPKQVRYNNAKEKIETDRIKMLSFIDSKNPIRLKCLKCGMEWNTNYYYAKKHKGCPMCNKKGTRENKGLLQMESEIEK